MFIRIMNKQLISAPAVYSLLITITDFSKKGRNSYLWLHLLFFSELLFIFAHLQVNFHVVHQPFILYSCSSYYFVTGMSLQTPGITAFCTRSFCSIVYILYI